MVGINTLDTFSATIVDDGASVAFMVGKLKCKCGGSTAVTTRLVVQGEERYMHSTTCQRSQFGARRKGRHRHPCPKTVHAVQSEHTCRNKHCIAKNAYPRDSIR